MLAGGTRPSLGVVGKSSNWGTRPITGILGSRVCLGSRHGGRSSPAAGSRCSGCGVHGDVLVSRRRHTGRPSGLALTVPGLSSDTRASSAPSRAARSRGSRPRARCTTARRSRTTGRCPRGRGSSAHPWPSTGPTSPPTTTRRPSSSGAVATTWRTGRLPHVSIKPWGTWREIAAGRRDDLADRAAATARRRRRPGLPDPAPRARERRGAGRHGTFRLRRHAAPRDQTWAPSWHRR